MLKKKSKSSHSPDDEFKTSENFRIYLDEIIRDFFHDPSQLQYDFPPHFSKNMRAYIHDKCQKLGLKSKSVGKEPHRILSIIKKGGANATEDIQLEFAPATNHILSNVEELRFPRNAEYKRFRMQYDSIGKAFQGSVTNVELPKNSQHTDFRKSLPVYQKRQTILDTINNNSVVIISAETGSGKTTQVPQYIIEEAAELKKKVKVICTQPRRLSTIAVAERVASERGEQLGRTIGYQIKLESKLGMDTAVIYCTNGVLLRTLMSGKECFQHITHIIVDEIHERDKFTDFLMIVLRENVKQFSHLRLILMSATMDMDAFVNYFDNRAFVLSIEGRSFSCCSWYLNDILHHVNFENARMKELRQLRERNDAPPVIIPRSKPLDSYPALDEECRLELNDILARCFDQGLQADFDELMQMYLNENVDPNYQDWTGKTALMAAARHGRFSIIEQLLNMGADMYLSSLEGVTASGWAQQANNTDVVNMLVLYQQPNPVPDKFCSESAILADYDRTINDEFVDYELVIEVIKHIHYNISKEGAILVFLPGYEDIVACQERIAASNIPHHDYKLFMLHGSMNIQAQHDVFQKFNNKQKIILSTNIAETSITIDDVRFVIDSGKAKVKTYDARSGITSLKSEWISMASSRQRAGRAGRTQNGYCFHLYSVRRYESFYVNPIPEILRTPLYELCLQTKMLAPGTMSIAEFLNLAIDPPKMIAVEEAVSMLKCLGALDDLEAMTDMGHHLVQFSIEPRLGKMLIYGTIFKCLDPILTIAASMAQKDPFILPSHAHLKQIALEKRKSLAEDSLSDHMIFIRAFQQWQDNKVQNRGYQFCNSNFISPGVMELITQTRSQLLSQLRAMGFVQASPKDSIAELNSNSNSWPMIKCCLAAGLYPNVAFYNDRSLHTKFDNVVFNGQSALKNSIYDGKGYTIIKKAWVVYDEISKPRIKTTIKAGTVITPLTIALICGQNTLLKGNCLVLDNAYALSVENLKVLTLRNNIQHVIYKKIASPHVRLFYEEMENINILASALMAEDAFYNIRAPDGIGRRPRITHLSSRNRFYDEHQHRERQSHTQNGAHYSHYGNYDKNRGNNCFGQAAQSDSLYSIDLRQSFPINALYFIINPVEEKEISIGLKQCSWNFLPHTEKKLRKLFNDGFLIYLIFYIRKSSELFGVAKFITSNGIPNQPCQVEWLSSNRIPIDKVKNLINLRQHLQEDGVQLDTSVGQQVCSIIYENGPNREVRALRKGPNVGPSAVPGPSRQMYYQNR